MQFPNREFRRERGLLSGRQWRKYRKEQGLATKKHLTRPPWSPGKRRTPKDGAKYVDRFGRAPSAIPRLTWSGKRHDPDRVTAASEKRDRKARLKINQAEDTIAGQEWARETLMINERRRRRGQRPLYGRDLLHPAYIRPFIGFGVGPA